MLRLRVALIAGVSGIIASGLLSGLGLSLDLLLSLGSGGSLHMDDLDNGCLTTLSAELFVEARSNAAKNNDSDNDSNHHGSSRGDLNSTATGLAGLHSAVSNPEVDDVGVVSVGGLLALETDERGTRSEGVSIVDESVGR